LIYLKKEQDDFKQKDEIIKEEEQLINDAFNKLNLNSDSSSFQSRTCLCTDEKMMKHFNLIEP
jgi:hypothetical protein